MSHELQIGGDPELFLFKDGKPVSAHPYIPGTKAKPHPLRHGCIQLDGIAVEFNIDPAKTGEEFEHNVNATLTEVKTYVPKGHDLVAVPSVIFEEPYFATIPEKFKELGCNPDFDAWSRKMNPSPSLKKFPTLRTGSGHLTFGYTDNMNIKDGNYFNDCCNFIQMIDPVWSQWSQVWDQDERRANLYGGPGAFRPKPFGVEYRRPSNAWVGYPKMYRWVFDLCAQMFDDAISGKMPSVDRSPKFDSDWLNTRLSVDTSTTKLTVH